MIGNVIDKYEILQKVGEGGMAVVYRGRHVTLGRDVAVKVLHPHLSSSSRNRRRFAREARAIEHLDHPNILRIFDYSGVESEECYIVTEFIDGVTLAEFIKERRRLPSEAVAMIGIRLASALRYAHAQGIIHRDIKPENIMIRRDGTLKLTDFGIARFLEEGQMTMTGALVGSPAYMSPEQAMEHRLDQRSDLFSLGTVLFHAVSGELPFTGSNPSVILRNIIEGNRPDVGEVAPDASPALADVIERLLQTDIVNRFQSAEEVAEALRCSVEQVGVGPDDPAFSLLRLITEPEAYRRDLEQHLCGALLARGRGFLEAGDHLLALRSFNRLLALDPDNEEVLALVQSLHSGPRHSPARKVSFASVAVLVALIGLTVVWLTEPDTAPTNPPPATGPGERIAQEGPEPFDGPSDPLPTDPGASETAVIVAPDPVRQPEAPTDPAELRGPEPVASDPTVATAPRVIPRPSKTALVSPLPQPATPPPGRPGGRDVAEEPGTLRVLMDEPGWAEIYLDGEHLGRTIVKEGEEPKVPPGRHHLVLRMPLCKDWEQDISIAPGEKFVLSAVRMSPLPATVNIAEVIGSDCVVSLDGVTLGTAGQIGRQFSLPEPRQAHNVEFRCPDSPPQSIGLEGVQADANLVVPELP